MELHIQTKEHDELIKLFCDEPLVGVPMQKSKINEFKKMIVESISKIEMGKTEDQLIPLL